MKISKPSLKRYIDAKFIGYLKNAYADEEKLDQEELFNRLMGQVSRNEYSPSLPKLLIDYNKGFGVCRPVPVLAPLDYFIFYYCIRRLEKVLAVNRVEGTFGGWRLGGNIQHKENAEAVESDGSPGSGLNPAAFAQKYGEFNSRIKSFLNAAPEDVKILEIDVANFYDSIRVDRLQNQVRSASSKAQLPVVDLLFFFLASCNRLLFAYRPQSTGIPQDVVSDCSRLLANFYLQDYDKKIYAYCRKYHIKYLRFADDQLFFIPANVSEDRVCKEASRVLYGLGLNINQKKTKVWTKNEITRYRCLKIFDILALKKTNQQQTTDDCNKFARATIKAIQQHKAGKLEIQNAGGSLLKKCIGLGLNKINKKVRKQLMELILDSSSLRYMKSYNLAKIYKSLNVNDKRLFIIKLDTMCSEEIHAAFIYEVMLFKRGIGLNWKRHGLKITRMTKEWVSA